MPIGFNIPVTLCCRITIRYKEKNRLPTKFMLAVTYTVTITIFLNDSDNDFKIAQLRDFSQLNDNDDFFNQAELVVFPN